MGSGVALTPKFIKGPAQEEDVYRPVGQNVEIFRSRDKEVLVEGPAGTGKSRACLEKLHAQMLKYPGARGAIVRKTRESLNQSALVTFEKEVTREQIKLHHEMQQYAYPNGSVVVVAGMDKPSKIMSSQYDVIYVQEATELEEEDWEAALTRLRNNVMPYQQQIGDCNPQGPEHWLNKRAASVMKRIVTRHEDNPTVTPEYLAILDSLTGYRYKRLRLGLWVAAEGQYFTEWDEEKHLCEPFAIPASWSRWAAIDYGYADPWCVLWFARDPKDKRRIYVYRELYQTGLRDEQQGPALLRAEKGERVSVRVGDPSMFNKRAEQNKPSIAFVYRKAQCLLYPAVNERIPGWQTVRSALAWSEDSEPRLQIMKGRAPNLVRTLPGMVHDPLDSEDLADRIKSQKTEDHAVDALRYGLVLEAMPQAQAAKLRSFRVEG